MAELRIFSRKYFLLLHTVYALLMSFATRSISATLETEVTAYNLSGMELPDNSLSNSSHGYQNLRVHFGRHRTRHRWARRNRHRVRSQASFSDYSQGRSIFKNVSEYYDEGIVLVVSLDGTAQYSNIQDAVDQVPEFNTRRVTIFVTSGVYEEKVIIPATKPYLTLLGEGRTRTIITWHDTAASAGTLMSASVTVESDHFIARDISFRNTAGYPAPNKTNMQAAAFRISGDKAFLYRCNFYGHQDTLYDHSGRHYYFRCFIEGSEDFIFGIARSLFERCWLHSIAIGEGGALVAQGKYFPGSIMGPSGFSFLRCNITGTGRPYLGRAWGTYSTVVYSYCQIDANIISVGWYDWGLRERDGTVYLGEYECTGKGANTTGRVGWSRELTSEDAQPFLSIQFVDGPW